ncbi:MAG: cell wall-binding repeat-containing protein [Coriobacteriia bacterium]
MIGSPVRTALVRGVLALMLGFSTVLPLGIAVAVEPDDTFATATPIAWPQGGELSDIDVKDIFTIEATGDSVITVMLDGPAGQDFDLYLYAPEALGATVPGTHIVAFSQAEGSSFESISYLVPPGATRTFFLEVKAFAGASGAYTLRGSVAKQKVPRLSGTDRYRTSYAVSASTFATASAVVVASGANFPDALSAAGLAGALNGPVLLAPPTTDANHPTVIDLCREVVRLGCTQVYVVGGETAVTAQVAGALSDIGRVSEPPHRVAGTNRYETALRVAEKIEELTGAPVSSAFVVRGDSYPDALAVSPFAYAERLPILLTRSTSLDAGVSAFIESRNTSDIVVAGGPSAISAGVAGALDRLNGGSTNVQRMFGEDRVATAVDVAEGCVDRGWGTWERIGIATASNFPDALSGGFACGERSGVLLLTNGTALSPAVATALRSHAVSGSMALMLGGPAAVTETVRSQIANLIP